MSGEKKQDGKRGIPGGFFLFLLSTILIVIAIQNFVGGKSAKVSFSHQLEHLVNMELIIPEASKKVALSDNLVTFTGKFRERETDEGKNRYKYLEFLNKNHELRAKKSELSEVLKGLQTSVRQSADWYLHLRGQPLAHEGYRVVDEIYDSPDRENRIVVRELSDKEIENIEGVKEKLSVLKIDAEDSELARIGSSIDTLVNNFRSPMLGIGDEQSKQSLRDLDDILLQAKGPGVVAEEKLRIYNDVFMKLQIISEQLNEADDYVRLRPIRSVINYISTLEEYKLVEYDLEENIIQLEKARQAVMSVIWFFDNQELSTRALEHVDSETYTQWFVNAREEWEGFESNKGGTFKAPDQPRNAVLEKIFKSEEPAPNYFSYVFTVLPIVLILLLLYFVFSRQMKGMGGGGAMNFGKSPAKLLTKDKNNITFKDVAGIDEAIEELEEIVEFLKNPTKFTVLGGRIPKGVLCVGPPGTGKTLIAKAVAGEADRPFFSISGSDFVEMFVGVGASRIRDMFEQAKKNAPCIIFMDEIDAVGRHRGAGIGGGHDEREQTLNQLLVELDGFDTNDGVILMAATNRPDVLDKALLRPGRFDRRIMIDLPDIKGRYEILKVHARGIKLDTSVDLMAIARATPGSSGADLRNLLNEAALLAARRERTAVTAQDTLDASDKVRFGKERRSLEIGEEDKRTTAYHESGHTIVGLVVEHADPVEKVTIIPRGFSLGATHFLPKKNRVSYWKKELIDQLAVFMGGRVAEEFFLEDISSGAQQDIEQATDLARNMVCRWGMSEKLGPVAYDDKSSGANVGLPGYYEKRYSESSAMAIDAEVRKLLDDAYSYAKKIISDSQEQLRLMAKMLIEFETLDAEDCQRILDGKWVIEDKRSKLKHIDGLHKKKAESENDDGKEPIDSKGEEGET